MFIDVVPGCDLGRGVLTCTAGRFACALGRNGVARRKREGDGCTPVGVLPLRRVLYRPDRESRPKTRLPVGAIAIDEGWCDDPGHPAYNRPVRLPFDAGHERLWRDDGLYDLVVVLGFNDGPTVPGGGSAIFLHVAHTEGRPTEGCVGLAVGDLRTVLEACGPESVLRVRPV